MRGDERKPTDLEPLRAALAAVVAKLARALAVREALARAAVEHEAARARIEGARRALVTAHADVASGAPVPADRLDALREELAHAERDVALRDEVQAELAERFEAVGAPLDEMQADLSRALAAAGESAGGAVLEEARRILAPSIARAAALSAAGSSAPSLGVVARLAQLLGVAFEHEAGSEDGKLAAEVKSATAALAALNFEINDVRRERYNAEQRALRDRGAHAP